MTRLVLHRGVLLGLVFGCLVLITGCFRSLGLDMPELGVQIPEVVKTTNDSQINIQPTSEPSGEITVMAVGDIMLGRSIGELILSGGQSTPFAHVKDIFHNADLVIGNLECAITDTYAAEQKRYTFSAPPEAAGVLADAGIDAVSLSNNHSMDFGLDGLVDTMASLSSHGIQYFGVGLDETQARAPIFLEKNGISIALLAYTDVPIESSTYFDTHSWVADDESPGLAWANVEEIRTDVSLARQQADLVFVYFHDGIENLDHATKAQHNLAIAAIDAGATVVLGTHSHRLQEIEHYKNGLIIYSLGNFIFDGFDELSNRSAILALTLSKDGLLSYEWYPVQLVDGIPLPADAETAKVIKAMLNREYVLFPEGIDEPQTSE